MADYILDTNHISPLVTIGHPLHRRILTQLQAGDTFSIPAPALTEFLYGINVIPRAKSNRETWQLLAPRFFIYDIDTMLAETAAELQISLRRRGRQLQTVDALIAATALRYHLTLLTTDKDFQDIPQLRRDNWY